MFSYFQPKGKKRNVKEYLKDGESEERFDLSLYSSNFSQPRVPQVVEKPTEVEYRPIPEFDRKYLAS